MALRRFGITFAEPDRPPTPDEVAAAFPEIPGLYLHVPFCRTLCPFCPYNKVRYRDGLAAAYLQGLERETALYLEVLPGPFPSLYVGGGTPTLCLDGLERLLGCLPVSGERAIEVLPAHMTPTGSERLRDLGFDFVSVGVQSFDPGVLHRLSRPGSPAGNRAAVETAAGRFACVDVDLVFDAAYDDPQVLLDDMALCFSYGVDQVSTYPLMRFGYTPFGKGAHDRIREHRVLATAAELADASGYERRSVWTFNRRGAPSYSSITRPYVLGLGAGSATFAGALFTVNHFGVAPYLRAVDAGDLPVARLARLPRLAAAGYRSFWQAYTGAVPFHPADPLLRHPAVAALRTVSRLLGWTRREGDVLRLTGRGYDRYHDLERWVTYHLIEPLWAELTAEHAAPPASGRQPVATPAHRSSSAARSSRSTTA